MDVDSVGLWQGDSIFWFIFQDCAEFVVHGGGVVIRLPAEVALVGLTFDNPHVGKYIADITGCADEIRCLSFGNDLAVGYGKGAYGTTNDEIARFVKKVTDGYVGYADRRTARPAFSAVATDEHPCILIQYRWLWCHGWIDIAYG